MRRSRCHGKVWQLLRQAGAARPWDPAIPPGAGAGAGKGETRVHGGECSGAHGALGAPKAGDGTAGEQARSPTAGSVWGPGGGEGHGSGLGSARGTGWGVKRS